MSSWLDVALLAVLIVLNGVFAMSEISLVTSRRARLQRLIDDKVAGAERARELNALTDLGQDRKSTRLNSSHT